MVLKCNLKQNATIRFKKLLTTQVAALHKTTKNYPKPNQFQSINLSFISNALKIPDVKGLSHKGKQLHSPMIKLGYQNELSLQNQLLSFYVKCSNSKDACKLFDEMFVRNVVTWNTLIRDSRMGLCYFRRMMLEKIDPDRVTCLNLVAMSIEVRSTELGRQFHCCIVKWGFCKDCYVSSCLVDMYAKLGFVLEARRVFDDVMEKDLVLWNVMVSCYALNWLTGDSFKIFWMMRLEGVKGDEFTYTSLVNCCVSSAYFDLGKQIHGLVVRFGFEQDIVVASALIDMYAKNESIVDARKVFDEMSPRNIISWNTMIVGYGQCNYGKESIKLLIQMLHEDIRPNELTLASVVNSCGNLSSNSQILQVHCYALKTGILLFLSVSNSFVNAYSKSGNIVSAFDMFDSFQKPDLVSYTSMVQAYAFHGLSIQAINLFKKMVLESESKPDKIMFLGVLSACSHGGFVTEGLHYFKLMTKSYKITPELEHYTCLVDLLGRAGQLNEAYNILISMPVLPGPDTLGSFIGHCKVYKNLELAKWASEKLVMLESNKNVNYALLSHAFACSGKWSDAATIREMMRDKCGLKEPGCSWLEVVEMTTDD